MRASQPWSGRRGVKGIARARHRAPPAPPFPRLAGRLSRAWRRGRPRAGPGCPGPGEPVLIAEAVFAARHKLDICSVMLVAWAGAAVGGVVGWLVGLKAGRALVTARGPLRRLRINAVARGEDVFARHPVLAIYLTPSWVAGIHRVRAAPYLTVNAIGSRAMGGWDRARCLLRRAARTRLRRRSRPGHRRSARGFARGRRLD